MSAFYPVEKAFWLHKVCEANYRKLADLIPDLSHLGDAATALAQDKPALHVRLLERSPYTLTLELTHDFAGGYEALAEPAVKIRVCLDAKTAEALSDATRPCVLDALRHEAGSAGAVLDYKWSLNYFLAKWLDHCLSSEYRFQGVRSGQAVCA